MTLHQIVSDCRQEHSRRRFPLNDIVIHTPRRRRGGILRKLTIYLQKIAL